jgi:hypothetical protein
MIINRLLCVHDGQQSWFMKAANHGRERLLLMKWLKVVCVNARPNEHMYGDPYVIYEYNLDIACEVC